MIYIFTNFSKDYELRCIVWDSKDVPKLDVEDAVDIFISGTLPGINFLI